jgi:hypothetical protein
VEAFSQEHHLRNDNGLGLAELNLPMKTGVLWSSRVSVKNWLSIAQS